MVGTRNRLVALLGTVLVVVAALSPLAATAAGGDLSVGVSQAQPGDEATVTVTQNGSAVANASVVVEPVGESSYIGAGNYTTDANGTVVLPAPENDSAPVTVTATAGNASNSTTAVIEANESDENTTYVATASGGNLTATVTQDGAGADATVNVTSNGSAVANASVVVSPVAGSSYVGSGTYATDANGTVVLPAPENDSAPVFVTASANNDSVTVDTVIRALEDNETENETDDNETDDNETDDETRTFTTEVTSGNVTQNVTQPGEGADVTVVVTSNGSAADGATVSVHHLGGGSYVGEGNYTTDGNGTVVLPGPGNDSAPVTIESSYRNESVWTDFVVRAVETDNVTDNETENETGSNVTNGTASGASFGQLVAAFASSFNTTDDGDNEPRGLSIAAFVTQNNPGNGNGPPAFVFGNDSENESGPGNGNGGGPPDWLFNDSNSTGPGNGNGGGPGNGNGNGPGNGNGNGQGNGNGGGPPSIADPTVDVRG